MLHFEESFFRGEEREGFWIKPMMKRAWAAQMEVLCEVDRICKRHGINYFADWGTLLGAVRHKGFIPWDDDIDIGMTRLDYVRFMSFAKKELPEGYRIVNVKENNNGQIIPRVVNSEIITTDNTFLERFHGCPYVVGIDIFVYDGIPLDCNEAKLQMELLKVTLGLSYRWGCESFDEASKMEYKSQVEMLCNISFKEDEPMDVQMFVLTDNICAMYWDQEVEELTYFPEYLYRPNYHLPKEILESFIEVPFENITIPIPTAYHEMLTIEYGNYMTPVKGTSSHNYPVYKEQEEMLFEKYNELGLNIPEMFKE